MRENAELEQGEAAVARALGVVLVFKPERSIVIPAAGPG